MRNWILVIFFLNFLSLLAQQPEARITKSKVVVGNRVELIYSIKLKKNDDFKFKKLSGNFPAKITNENSSLKGGEFNEIEIVNFDDSIIVNGKDRMWIGVFELCAWDSGLVVLEGPRFTLNDSTGSFPSTYLQCNLIPHKKGKGIYDIKESFIKAPVEKDWLYYGTLYVFWWLIPLIFYLIYRWRKRSNDKPETHIYEISLKQKSLLAVDALEKAELWKRERLKEHFVELSYILRSYLTSRYDLNLLDKTTYETKLILTAKKIDKEVIDSILRILNHSDMVKFAASRPGEEIIEKSFFMIRQLIVETSPIEYQHAE
jgi:hypothetical protein